MKAEMQKQAEQYLRQRKIRNIIGRLIACLSVFVALGTSYVLMSPGETLNRTPECGYAEHQHTESCYAQVLTCEEEEREEVTLTSTALTCSFKGHVHDADCYDPAGNRVCGRSSDVWHKHDSFCYDADGKLVCRLDENPAHEHYAFCYKEVQKLVCEIAENSDPTTPTDMHIHGDDCYVTDRVLTCGQEEPHLHTSSACFEDREDKDGNTWRVCICGKIELKSHQHTADCWTTSTEVIPGHQHGVDCYAQQLICELPEHTHVDACYPIPTETPTAEPTLEPTEEPTAEPTAEPTEEPTAEPTAEPTEEPTTEPIVTAEPTEDPYGIGILESPAEDDQVLTDLLGDLNDQMDDLFDDMVEQGVIQQIEVSAAGDTAPAGPGWTPTGWYEGYWETAQDGVFSDDAHNGDLNASNIKLDQNKGEITLNVDFDFQALGRSVDLNAYFEQEGWYDANGNRRPGGNGFYGDTYSPGEPISFRLTGANADALVNRPAMNGFDYAWSDTKRAFTFDVTKNTDGSYQVNIHFTKEYANYVRKNNKGVVDASLSMEMKLGANNQNSNGDFEISLGDQTVIVDQNKINYPEGSTLTHDIKATKGQPRIDLANNTIEYTVTINSTKGTPGDIVLNDALTATGFNASLTKMEYQKNNYGAFQSVNYNGGSSSSNPTFNATLPALGKNETYQVKYTYKIDSLNGGVESITADNKVKVSSQDPNKPGEKVEYESGSHGSAVTKVGVDKSGNADYNNQKVNWQITITSNGNNIAGYKAYDTAYAEAFKELIDANPDADSWDIPGSYFGGSTGELKLRKNGSGQYYIEVQPVNNNVNNKNYTIRYSTPFPEDIPTTGTTVTNTVELKDKDDNDKGKDTENVGISGNGTPGPTWTPGPTATPAPQDDGYKGLRKQVGTVTVDPNNPNIRTIQWTFSFLGEPGKNLKAGNYIQDELVINDSASNGHYFTQTQMLAIYNTVRSMGFADASISDPAFVFKTQTYNDGYHQYSDFDPNASADSVYKGFYMKTNKDMAYPDATFNYNGQNVGEISFTYYSTIDMTKTPNSDKLTFKNKADNDRDWPSAQWEYEKGGVTKTNGNNQSNNTNVTINEDGEAKLTWRVRYVPTSDVTDKVTITDTFPANVRLESMKLGSADNQLNYTVQLNNGSFSGEYDHTTISGTYSDGGFTLNFNKKNGEDPTFFHNPNKLYVEYVVSITNFDEAISDLKDSGEASSNPVAFKNEVKVRQDELELPPVSQEQDVTYTWNKPVSKTIGKDAVWDSDAHVLTFRVIINPDGAHLSLNQNNLTVDDVIMYRDGNYVRYFEDHTDNNPQIAEIKRTVSYVTGSAKLYYARATTSGDMIPDGTVPSYSWSVQTPTGPENAVSPNVFADNTSKGGNGWGIVSYGQETINVNGQNLNYTKNDISEMQYWSYDGDHQNLVQKMTASVPDDTPLILEYQYRIDIDDVPDFEYIDHADGDTIKEDKLPVPIGVLNRATLKDSNQSATEDESSNDYQAVYGSGVVRTATTVQKVDSTNPGKLLSGAVFEVYKYVDGANDELVTTYTTTKGVFTIEKPKRNAIYDDNVLYYFVEVQAPVGYKIGDETRHYFYFNSEEDVYTPAVTVGSTPLNFAEKSYQIIIPNTLISTTASVQKVWADELPHDPITVYLRRYKVPEDDYNAIMANGSSQMPPDQQMDITFAVKTNSDTATKTISGLKNHDYKVVVTYNNTESWMDVWKVLWDGQSYADTASLEKKNGVSYFTSVVSNVESGQIEGLVRNDNGNGWDGGGWNIDSVEDIGLSSTLVVYTDASMQAFKDGNYEDSAFVVSQKVNAAQNWKHTWRNLEAYEADMDSGITYHYVYYVAEDPVPGYSSKIERADNAFGYKITNTGRPVTKLEPTSIKVHKQWIEDGEDVTADKTDAAVTIKLWRQRLDSETGLPAINEDGTTREPELVLIGGYKTSITLDSLNDWTYEYTGLDWKEDDKIVYSYTLEEEPVEGYEIAYIETESGVNVTGSAAGKEVTVVNTKGIPDSGSLKVFKTWSDGKSDATSVTFRVIQHWNDQSRTFGTYTMTAAEMTAGKLVEALPLAGKVDGVEVSYTYSVEEVSYTDATGTYTLENGDYAATYAPDSIAMEKDVTKDATITNTFVPKKGSLLVKKVVANAKNMPTAISFKVVQNWVDADSNAQSRDLNTYTLTDFTNGITVPELLLRGYENGRMVDYTYSVVELTVTDSEGTHNIEDTYYLVTYSADDVTLVQDQATEITITNDEDRPGDLNVTKKWQIKDNGEVTPNGIQSITFQLWKVAADTPIETPTVTPTETVTVAPTTVAPTEMPTVAPTTAAPTETPTVAPTTAAPTETPTVAPTTAAPTDTPTAAPTATPTVAPTTEPSGNGTLHVTLANGQEIGSTTYSANNGDKINVVLAVEFSFKNYANPVKVDNNVVAGGSGYGDESGTGNNFTYQVIAGDHSLVTYTFQMTVTGDDMTVVVDEWNASNVKVNGVSASVSKGLRASGSKGFRKSAPNPNDTLVGTYTITAADGWTWDALTAGVEIDKDAEYYIVEINTPDPWYTLEASGVGGNQPVAIVDGTASITLTNEMEIAKININVTKSFKYNSVDGTPSHNVKEVLFSLHKADGTVVSITADNCAAYGLTADAIRVRGTESYLVSSYANGAWTTVTVQNLEAGKYYVTEAGYVTSTDQFIGISESEASVAYSVNGGDETDAATAVAFDNDDSITIVNKVPDPFTLNVTKQWLDANGNAITEDIPKEIKVQLMLVTEGDVANAVPYNGSVTLTCENGSYESNANGVFTLKVENEAAWSLPAKFTFSALPSVSEDFTKNYTYYLKELDIPADFAVSYVPNAASTSERTDILTGSTNVTITNTKLIDIDVIKTWVGMDGNVDWEVTFGLYKQTGNAAPVAVTVNGTALTGTLTDASDAPCSFVNLPLLAAGEKYVVIEDQVKVNGFTYTGAAVADAANAAGLYELTNYLTKLPVEKVWNGLADGTAWEVEFKLQNNIEDHWYDVEDENGLVTGKISSNDTEAFEFKNLPEGLYRVVETKATVADVVYNDLSVISNEGDNGKVILTNELDTIKVIKTWDGMDGEVDWEITFGLYKQAGDADPVAVTMNGTALTGTLDSDSDAPYSFVNLPLLGEGEKYVVIEDQVKVNGFIYAGAAAADEANANGLYELTNYLTKLPVEKVWNGLVNSTAWEIEFRLEKNIEDQWIVVSDENGVVTGKISSTDTETFEFKNLPEGQYRVVETSATVDGMTYEPRTEDGSAVYGMPDADGKVTLTNDLTSFEAIKAWTYAESDPRFGSDVSEEDKETVKFQLYRKIGDKSEPVGEEVELAAKDADGAALAQTKTWNNLPKFGKIGEGDEAVIGDYSYYVVETSTGNYVPEHGTPGANTAGIMSQTVTNEIKQVLNVTKIWMMDGVKITPASVWNVEFVLQKQVNGQWVNDTDSEGNDREGSVNNANPTYQFSELSVDADYRVLETSATINGVTFKPLTSTLDEVIAVRNTETKAYELVNDLTQLNVTKVWKYSDSDTDEVALEDKADVTFKLYRKIGANDPEAIGTVTLPAVANGVAADQTYTWTELPLIGAFGEGEDKQIGQATYYAEEVVPDDAIYTVDNGEVDAQHQQTVTNTIPRFEIVVTKTWNGMSAGAAWSVTFQLQQQINGEWVDVDGKTGTLTSAEPAVTEVVFDKLLVSDTFRVIETSATVNGVTYAPVNAEGEPIEAVTTDANETTNNMTVTNDLVSFEATKVWAYAMDESVTVDDTDKSDVTFQLYRKIGEEGAPETVGDAKILPVFEADGTTPAAQKAVWTDLPVYGTIGEASGAYIYYVTEVVPDDAGYVVEYGNVNDQNQQTVTNTIKLFNLEVEKEWNGMSAGASWSVTFQLQQLVDGQWEDVEGKTGTLSSDEPTVTKVVFEGLSTDEQYQVVETSATVNGVTYVPVDEDGQPILGYVTSTGVRVISMVVTNNLTSFEAAKVWAYADDADEVVADEDKSEVTFQLYRKIGEGEGTTFGAPVTIAVNGNPAVWNDLPISDANGVYSYYVKETSTGNYTASEGDVDNNKQTITNTITRIHVAKKWFEADGVTEMTVAPSSVTSVTFKLFATDATGTKAEIGTYQIFKGNDWKWSMSGIDPTLTYEIVETSYQVGDKSYEIDENGGSKGDYLLIGVDQDATDAFTWTIKNKQQTAYTLPETGSTGTTPLYTIGLLMVLLATIGLMYNQIKRKERAGRA